MEMAAMSKARPINPQVLSKQRFGRRFAIAMAVYTILVVTSQQILNTLNDSIWRYPVALLPVVPLLVVFWLFLVYLREMDELLRRIQFEAFGISLGATLIFTITWGFLEAADLLPPFPTIFIGPVMILLWGFGSWLTRRRYNAVCETE
jgi:hypothetical protein